MSSAWEQNAEHLAAAFLDGQNHPAISFILIKESDVWKVHAEKKRNEVTVTRRGPGS